MQNPAARWLCRSAVQTARQTGHLGHIRRNAQFLIHST